MPRSLSFAFQEAFFASETDKTVILLLRVYHPSIPEPIRVCLNTEKITSLGKLYMPYLFAVNLMEERSDRAPVATLQIDNVDRAIVQGIRSEQEASEVQMELVLADDPDTVEVTTPRLVWRHTTWTATMLEGKLEGPAVYNRRYPAHSFNPSWVPGIFRGI